MCSEIFVSQLNDGMLGYLRTLEELMKPWTKSQQLRIIVLEFAYYLVFSRN